jgi:hypothetical protein
MSKMISDFDQSNPWLILKSIYGVDKTGKGQTLRFQSALIDGARYSACLAYVFATDGIYVRKMSFLPFVSRQNALFIPWDNIEIIKTDYWTTYPFEIHIHQVPKVDFRVRRQIGNALIRCKSEQTSEKR